MINKTKLKQMVLLQQWPSFVGSAISEKHRVKNFLSIGFTALFKYFYKFFGLQLLWAGLKFFCTQKRLCAWYRHYSQSTWHYRTSLLEAWVGRRVGPRSRQGSFLRILVQLFNTFQSKTDLSLTFPPPSWYLHSHANSTDSSTTVKSFFIYTAPIHNRGHLMTLNMWNWCRPHSFKINFKCV